MAMVKLFLVLIVGFVCHKGKVFPDSAQTVLTRVVLYATTPCTILYSVLSNDNLPNIGTIALLLLASLVCYAVTALVAVTVVKLLRIRPGERGVYISMLLFSNCGFIGFPVVQTIFGDEAVFYASVCNIPFNLLLFTLGAWLMQRDSVQRGSGSKALKLSPASFLSPCLVASVLAVVLALTKWRAPGVICDTIGMIGDITTPASLLVIGISIAKQPLKNMLGSPKLYLLTAVRLLVLPALVWAILHPFVNDTLLIGVAVVLFGMPVATMVPMLADEHGADETDAVRGVFLSTVLSMVTIPLLVTILM